MLYAISRACGESLLLGSLFVSTTRLLYQLIRLAPKRELVANGALATAPGEDVAAIATHCTASHLCPLQFPSTVAASWQLELCCITGRARKTTLLKAHSTATAVNLQVLRVCTSCSAQSAVEHAPGIDALHTHELRSRNMYSVPNKKHGCPNRCVLTIAALVLAGHPHGSGARLGSRCR
jgi:hypothetical protein